MSTYTTFPTFGNKEDASKFGYEMEDAGIRSSMEGGYVITRARFTRAPRRTWTTGFTDLSNDEFNTFVDFFKYAGTYEGFTYVVPTSKEVVNVRLSQKPTFKYSGFGPTFRWDITDIKLEEV